MGEAAFDPVAARTELRAALARFDEPTAQEILDRVLLALTVEAALRDVVLPYLHELGDGWARGEVTVAQEHFATGVVRGRMFGLARGWGSGLGPAAVLACLPGEYHDLGLIAFGLALRTHGWWIVYLGTDTPLDTVEETCRALAPTLVVLNAVSEDRVAPILAPLRTLASRHRVALGGAAAEAEGARPFGVLALGGDPIAEAERVTALVRDEAPAS